MAASGSLKPEPVIVISLAHAIAVPLGVAATTSTTATWISEYSFQCARW